MPISVRPGLDAIAAYRQGRSAPEGASKLSSNESPDAPLPSVARAVADRIAMINRYPDMGARALVEQLAAVHDVPVSTISVGAGSVEVAAQLIHAVTAPGDEVVFAWRSFEAYPALVRIAGATPVPVPLDADGAHDLDAMLAAVTDRTRLIFVCNPNNPTGTVVDADRLERFVAAVPQDVLVVIDEAYVHFDRSASRDAGLRLFRRHPHVAVLHTFSKAYGLAGLRIGYAVAPEAVTANLRKVAVPFAVTDLAQTAALASLAAQAELDERIDAIVARRARLLQLLADAGWDPLPSQANFVWVPAGERTEALERALTDHGVITRAFAGEGIRISVGSDLDMDRVQTALTLTASAVDATAEEVYA